jgi:DNA repair protein RadC
MGRRFREDELQEEKIVVRSAKDIVDILMPRMRDLKKEVFKVAFLNSKSSLISIHEVTRGSVNQAYPIIREIFHKALQSFASFIVCIHNHPPGNVGPSDEDIYFTEEICKVGKVMQIKVLDHIIIGDNKYFSFSDAGIISEQF